MTEKFKPCSRCAELEKQLAEHNEICKVCFADAKENITEFLIEEAKLNKQIENLCLITIRALGLKPPLDIKPRDYLAALTGFDLDES